MNAQDFVYWLQGFAELQDAPPNKKQWQQIRDHLALVFNKVTPDYTLPTYLPPRDYLPYWPAPPYEVTCSVSNPAASDTRAVC